MQVFVPRWVRPLPRAAWPLARSWPVDGFGARDYRDAAAEGDPV